MYNLTDDSTAIATALVNDSRDLLNVVAHRDVRTTFGAAVQMRRALGNLDRRLDALRRGLLRDLELRLEPPRRTADEVAPSPYRTVRLQGGDEGEALARLTDADLREHLRGHHWWYQHEPNPQQRWNTSKRFPVARRELVARGHEHDAWMDGTEGADA